MEQKKADQTNKPTNEHTMNDLDVSVEKKIG
jgi:hypothetical protein